MTFDFRASQLRTSKIIASGSTGTNAQLLFYPIAADGTPANQGNINPVVFGTGSIGQDVWFFVSGAIGGLDGTERNVAAFGGDVHISGNLRVGTVLFSALSSSIYGLSSSYTALSAAFVTLSSSVAASSSYLADETTLTLSSNTFSVKTAGIQTTHLSASAVTPAKADLTGDWSFISGSVRVATPVSNSHATPKSYVLSAISESIGGGASINAAKGAVRTVLVGDDETTELFAYNAGAKTLTFQGNASLNDFEIGGITDFQIDDRILFAIPLSASCFAASGSWSGIYTITNVGADDPSGSAPVFTRASDFDSTSEVTPGSFVFALSGDPDTLVPDIWYLSTSGSITLDTTPLLFVTASFGTTGSAGAIYTGSSTIDINGSNEISVKNNSIGPGYLSGSIANVSGGLSFDPGNGLSVNTTGALGIDNNSVYVRPFSIGPAYISASVAGNGLIFVSDLQVLADPVFQNPLVVSSSGTSVRAASATQSGYMSTASFQQLASVVSYSAIPATAGGIANAVTTSNTVTAQFNIGTVPADTIWTVKFTTFSIDTANAANLVNNVGAFSIYRSGSSDVTQVGSTEVEHSFVSGAFTSITMSLNLAGGGPGNADFVLQGIDTYNIKHWATFKITEFVYG